jgi:hypothetical protein
LIVGFCLFVLGALGGKFEKWLQIEVSTRQQRITAMVIGVVVMIVAGGAQILPSMTNPPPGTPTATLMPTVAPTATPTVVAVAAKAPTATQTPMVTPVPVASKPECPEMAKMTEVLPEGTVNQGGFLFSYQSGQSPSCIRYELRNGMNRRATSFIWQSNGSPDTFIEGRLEECTADPCKVESVTKIWPFQTVLDRSTIHFGSPDRNQYSEQVGVYRIAPPSVGLSNVNIRPESPTTILTEISGTFVNSQNQSFTVNVQVVSEISRNNEQFNIRQAITLLPGSANLRVLPREGIPAPNSELGLVWAASSEVPVAESFGNRGLSQDARQLLVNVQTREPDIANSMLIITQGGERLAATTAPSFRAR